MQSQRCRKQFLVGGRGARLHRRDSTATILVNFTVVLHVGNIQIQIVQLKYFKASLPKEIFLTTSSKFPEPCMGIEILIVTSAFER